MSEMPESPAEIDFNGDISQLDGQAIHAYEIFSSLQRSGFTSQDALTLVGHLISSGFMELYRPNLSDPKVHLELEDEDYLGPDDLDDEDFI
jgi:hypothetical protein